MAGGEYWSAAVSIRRCWQLEQDPVLVALVTDGELLPMTPDTYTCFFDKPDPLCNNRAAGRWSRTYFLGGCLRFLVE